MNGVPGKVGAKIHLYFITETIFGNNVVDGFPKFLQKGLKYNKKHFLVKVFTPSLH